MGHGRRRHFTIGAAQTPMNTLARHGAVETFWHGGHGHLFSRGLGVGLSLSSASLLGALCVSQDKKEPNLSGTGVFTFHS